MRKGSDSAWFYTDRVPYFLEPNGNTNNEIKNNTDTKNGSSTILHNLEEKKIENVMPENELQFSLFLLFFCNRCFIASMEFLELKSTLARLKALSTFFTFIS